MTLHQFNTAEELRVEAEKLLFQCKQLSEINGLKKLKRKINAELQFLRKNEEENGADSELKCSNLPHLRAIVNYLSELDEPAETMKMYKVPECADEELSSVVDVVTKGGREWRKFVARNPAALHRDWKGLGDFKHRTLITQMEDFLVLRTFHPVNYQIPKIYVHFLDGIHYKMADYLESRDIHVIGTRISDSTDFVESVTSDDDFIERDVNDFTDDIIDHAATSGDVVNLDITACIALISEVCHGGCWFVFTDPVLTEQAEQERRDPVLPGLQTFLAGKSLYICQTAYKQVKTIVNTIGGANERQRFVDLMKKVTLVDDAPSKRTESLLCRGKIRERNKLVFGTGDKLKAVTVTANSGFVRAASVQGVNFTVFVHPARALTEEKESTARQISMEQSED